MREGSERCDSHVAARPARISGPDMYEALYSRALDFPEEFWGEHARSLLSWQKGWDETLRSDFEEGRIEWFRGGTLNAAHNCLDRHIETLSDKPAYVGVAPDGQVAEIVTYGDLFRKVNDIAAVLKARGVGRGDRVVLYMPTIPELPTAMLACARIGAVHCVVSSGFGIESLAYRVSNSQAKAVITVDTWCGLDQGASLKARVDEALKSCPSVETVFVVPRRGGAHTIAMTPGRDLWLHDAVKALGHSRPVAPEWMDAEDPLFILYVGGPTGKPKGIVHTHGGYLLYASFSARTIFDLRDDDVLWIADDLAWIFGHTYGVYGALLNGVSSVLWEGISDAAPRDLLWALIQKHKVTNFWTLPTIVRRIASRSPESADAWDLSTLRMAGFMQETVDDATWNWTNEKVGRGRCPILHGYGQTETGGMIMAPFPAVRPPKPGYCALPFFGVKPLVLDPITGDESAYPDQEGVLCVDRPWPGVARTIFGDHDRYLEGTFYRVPGAFFTGDGALKDSAGEFRVTGRVDDVIISAGRRIGIPELESALMRAAEVREAAVVGFPHPIKGRGVYAFVQVVSGASEDLKASLKKSAIDLIGDFAVIDGIQWVETLPKTPSGKILRVILQRIAAGDVENLGEFGAIADPAVVKDLIDGRRGLEST